MSLTLSSIARIGLAVIGTLAVFVLQYLSISNTPSGSGLIGNVPWGVLFSYVPIHGWPQRGLEYLNPVLGFPLDSIVRYAGTRGPGHWSRTIAFAVLPLDWGADGRMNVELSRLNYVILTLWNTAFWLGAFISAVGLHRVWRGTRLHPARA